MDWESATVMVFAVLLTVNIGILAINESNTGVALIGTGEDMNAMNPDLTPQKTEDAIRGAWPTDDNGMACPTWAPCKTEIISGA